MKVLAIVLGSIAALVVLSVVALAIMLPIVGKKFIASSRDPAARRATLSKIADFTIPAGFKTITAIDLGITQTAYIAPIDRSKYSLILQLTSQHLAASEDKTLLDQMASSVSFGEKVHGCDLKNGPDDTIVSHGKAVKLRTLSCARDGSAPLNVEIALVHAKASTVQLVATDVRTPDDRAALVSFVASMK